MCFHLGLVSTQAGCFVIMVSAIRTAARTMEERFCFGKKPMGQRDKRCQRCQCFGSGTGILNIVTIVTHWHRLKFLRGAGGFFQKAALAPRRAQNLLAGCIFVGGADKSAFALLSQKVTKACACRRRKDRIRIYAENDKRNGWERLGQSQQP